MRILYLHQYFNTPEEAGGTRSYEMARRMVSAGHEVHMITTERNGRPGTGSKWYTTEESGIMVHWTPVPYGNDMGYRHRMQAFLQYAWRAALKAASFEAEIVFATSTPLTIALPAVYAAKKRNIPLVFEVRDLWPELPIAVGALRNPAAVAAARWLERFAYRNSARVIALSPDMKAGVARAGYSENRITVIPNICDLDLFDVDPELGNEIRRKHDWLGERPLIVYIGTYGFINGLEYLARLAAAIMDIDPEIRFALIGSGREEEKVRRMAAELDVLNKNFFMLERIPKIEVPRWLAAADASSSVFIDLKEMWANSANKFFDALAAGKPVIINYGGWQAALIHETGAGLVLHPQDLQAAARNIAGAVRDKDWLKRTGEAARALARERFSRDDLARELINILETTSREATEV